MSREAMQMALDMLNEIADDVYCDQKLEGVITALRQALEEKQEPVAWITDGGKGELWWYRSSKFDEEGTLIGPNLDDIPLYTAPSKQWVSLTDGEIDILSCETVKGNKSVNWLCKVLEAKLREKNHG